MGIAVALMVTIAAVLTDSRITVASASWAQDRFADRWELSAGFGGGTEPGIHARDRFTGAAFGRNVIGARVLGPAGRGDRCGRAFVASNSSLRRAK
jgi:hypothetical protein